MGSYDRVNAHAGRRRVRVTGGVAARLSATNLLALGRERSRIDTISHGPLAEVGGCAARPWTQPVVPEDA
jgi:hypothetical protein